jgi:hypothetical protein
VAGVSLPTRCVHMAHVHAFVDLEFEARSIRVATRVPADCIPLVERAIGSFNAGDDEAFLVAFHPDVSVYAEPQLAIGGLQGRAMLAGWLHGLRQRRMSVRMRVANVTEHEGRVAGDVLIMGGAEEAGSGWRMSVAVWFDGGLISEARLFWHREAALAALENGPS